MSAYVAEFEGCSVLLREKRSKKVAIQKGQSKLYLVSAVAKRKGLYFFDHLPPSVLVGLHPSNKYLATPLYTLIYISIPS